MIIGTRLLWPFAQTDEENVLTLKLVSPVDISARHTSQRCPIHRLSGPDGRYIARTLMKFTVADLLDQLSDTVEISALAKILKLTSKSDKQSLELAITALSKLGVVQQNDNGGVLRTDDDGLIDARLRCSSKGFCFAIRDDGGDDIYIRDHQLNHAWNGDRVLVRVPGGGRRRSPEGGVQCILERTTRSLLAQVEENQLTASPLDDRMLTTISFQTTLLRTPQRPA